MNIQFSATQAAQQSIIKFGNDDQLKKITEPANPATNETNLRVLLTKLQDSVRSANFNPVSKTVDIEGIGTFRRTDRNTNYFVCNDPTQPKGSEQINQATYFFSAHEGVHFQHFSTIYQSKDPELVAQFDEVLAELNAKLDDEPVEDDAEEGATTDAISTTPAAAASAAANIAQQDAESQLIQTFYNELFSNAEAVDLSGVLPKVKIGDTEMEVYQVADQYTLEDVEDDNNLIMIFKESSQIIIKKNGITYDSKNTELVQQFINKIEALLTKPEIVF